VFDVAESVLARIPKSLLDTDQAYAGLFTPDSKGRVPSLSTVLKQEIDRFNNLLRVLWRSLEDIKKAIKGFVVMSSDLEKIYNSFLNNSVPSMWATAAYPSLKPLGSWVIDLSLRLAAVHSWLTQHQPPSFWISGFFFPQVFSPSFLSQYLLIFIISFSYVQGFITGILQTYARKYNLPIDTLGFKFQVLTEYFDQQRDDNPALPAITDGVLVHGLFMDGGLLFFLF
jgi:dynein heavy chain